MKKKIIGAMSVVLVTSMLAASLTGCGTRVEATDQEIAGEETIIVTDDESSEDAIVDAEDNVDETEEVVVDDVNTDVEAAYTEHEYFYVRDELDMTDTTPMDMNALEVDGTTYTLNESVNIYMPSVGALKGYTKPNIDVYVNSCNEDWYCLYFENEESPNNYVLVKADDFIASTGMYENMPAVTADDVKFALINQLYDAVNGVDEKYYIALDDATEEMNLVVEFTIPTYCRDLDDSIAQIVADNDFGNYKYFRFEKVEEKSDEENSCFRVTYGALQ